MIARSKFEMEISKENLTVSRLRAAMENLPGNAVVEIENEMYPEDLYRIKCEYEEDVS